MASAITATAFQSWISRREEFTRIRARLLASLRQALSVTAKLLFVPCTDVPIGHWLPAQSDPPRVKRPSCFSGFCCVASLPADDAAARDGDDGQQDTEESGGGCSEVSGHTADCEEQA